LNDYIKLLRPHHWVKNLFVFIPAFFAAKIGLITTRPAIVLAFVAFCLIASAVYIINDILDLENDRRHEEKNSRPIASRRIPRRRAVAVSIILITLSLAAAFAAGIWVLYVILGYLALNLLYSSYLKHISLIDISCIAIGFVLRVIAGGFAAEVPVSKWLILMTFLLACCLALGKRRHDLSLDVEKTHIRRALDGYTLGFVDTCLIVLSGTTIVCYIMYTVSEDVVHRLHSENVYLTAIFVIIGLLRFLQIAIVEQKSGSPTLILLKDRMIQVVLLLWLAAFAAFLYAI
jgi:4-hydroxybenzoate polyprenyltransferase